MNINELKAFTTITIGPNVIKDAININGKEISLEENSRFKRVFKVVFFFFMFISN